MTINTKEARALVERLETFADGCRGSMWQSRNGTVHLMDEAAAAITAALDEVERLREAATQASVAINQAEYEVAWQALKVALKGTDQ